MSTIGTLNEKPLHAALKLWVARPGDRFEVPLDGYVIDIVRRDRLIEIQTGGFSPLKKKFKALLKSHPVRLVYPIAAEKWVVKHSQEEGVPPSRRKSRTRGRVEHLFKELVRLPDLLNHDNFSLEILMIQEEEVQRYVGKRRWRKRGWETEERRLLDVIETHLFESPRDLLKLLPADLDEPYTTEDLAKTLRIRRDLAQKIAYCMRHMGAIEQIGKRNRSNLYRLSR